MNHHHHHIQGLIASGTKHVVRRTFAAGKAKKGGRGGGDAPLSKEIKSTTVVGANTLKDGSDPNISPASTYYPDWVWRLLHNRPALSELRRKNVETLPYDDLKRFVKLHTRSKIKENNSIKANN
ncbi:F28 protein [Hirschfeldia incana]|nr:F28 protein [Hirschfeldia incana]KAJ0237333.1 F28 protein [Hirschfeldia incana]